MSFLFVKKSMMIKQHVTFVLSSLILKCSYIADVLLSFFSSFELVLSTASFFVLKMKKSSYEIKRKHHAKLIDKDYDWG